MVNINNYVWCRVVCAEGVDAMMVLALSSERDANTWGGVSEAAMMAKDALFGDLYG